MSNTTNKFRIFNGKREIEINTNLIKEYEEKVGPFTEKTVEYLIVTLGLTSELATTEIVTELEQAMSEDCNDSSLVKEILSDKNNREELFHA